MLKVFTTERLWECINDVFQIYGGSAYFTDLPLERMLRDARINQIGEGANEVLTSFIALVGMRGPGMEFKEIYDTMMKPSRDGMSKAWAAGKNRLSATVRVPDVPVQSEQLRAHARQLGRLIRHLIGGSPEPPRRLRSIAATKKPSEQPAENKRKPT